MEYNTKEVYFGYPTYNISNGDFWYTAPEAFLKKEDKYIKINSKKKVEFNEFQKGTDEYETVSRISPITRLMSNKKEIPETISGLLIKMYLLKFKMEEEKKSKQKRGSETPSKTK